MTPALQPSIPPMPQAPVGFAPPPFEYREMPSGLRVILCPGRISPILHLQLALPVGASLDPPESEGLASLAAPLLLAGSGRRDRREIARFLAPWGGRVTAEAGWDATWLATVVPPEGGNAALELLADLLLRPSFPAPAIDHWRRRRLQELEHRRQVPAVLADDVLQALLYGDSTYRRPPQGTPEGLRHIGRRALVDFHRLRYRGPGLILTAVGPFDPESLLQRADDALTLGKPAGSEATGPLPAPAAKARGGAILVDLPQAAQTELRVGCTTVPLEHPDMVGLQLLSSLLGRGFSSRLSQRLREEQALAYSAYSRIEARRGSSPWVLGAAVETRRAGEALAGIRQEVERLRREPIADRELGAAKSYLIGLAQTSLRSGGALAGFFQHLALQGFQAEIRERYDTTIRSLDSRRLQALAERYLAPSRLAVVAVGPAQRLDAPLREYLPGGAFQRFSKLESGALDFDSGGAAAQSQ